MGVTILLRVQLSTLSKTNKLVQICIRIPRGWYWLHFVIRGVSNGPFITVAGSMSCLVVLLRIVNVHRSVLF